ncbi:MAG: GNAT family N-acetyltransferase, partial [Spongiibacteraceae bacterium]
PATGPRVLIAPGEDVAAILAHLFGAIKKRVGDDGLSTFHLLFPDETLRSSPAARQLAQRVGVQYHWFNRGFNSFDDFLATFNSRKRKNLRKERERVTEQGLALRVQEGAEISAADWRRFHHFYQLTYAKRSGHGGYLGVEFFLEIGRTLRDQIVLITAQWQGETVAGALNFRDRSTLYGRYWGCAREFEFLHFEACYYQGIDYCIREGLQHFDPGAQGEHKIQRGFEPIATYSLHWVEQPVLRRAVADFVARERIDIERYRQEACGLLPFKTVANI